MVFKNQWLSISYHSIQFTDYNIEDQTMIMNTPTGTIIRNARMKTQLKRIDQPSDSISESTTFAFGINWDDVTETWVKI